MALPIAKPLLAPVCLDWHACNDLVSHWNAMFNYHCSEFTVFNVGWNGEKIILVQIFLRLSVRSQDLEG